MALLRKVADDPGLTLQALGEVVLPAASPDGAEAADAATAAVPAAAAAARPAAGPRQDPRVEYLQAMWSRMLETGVKPGDNFFDLGGHSMLAVQMASEVFKDTGFKLKLMPLATQTLAQLAMELPRSAFPDDGSDDVAAGDGGAVDAQSAERVFHFGRDNRLFGMLHRAASGAGDDVLLVAPPLLQEGIASQRALWTLCETASAAGTSVLRFDWFGSGESAGRSDEMTMATLQQDLGDAAGRLAPSGTPRTLALRSACLPLLAAAGGASAPVDLVLWDPVLDGGALVDAWKRQHQEQLQAVGRYLPGRGIPPAASELLGFDVCPDFVDALAQADFRRCALPAGSRVLVAAWEIDAALQAFIDIQQGAGVSVQTLVLVEGEQPAWSDPAQFENQAYPRRSVAKLGQALAEGRR